MVVVEFNILKMFEIITLERRRTIVEIYVQVDSLMNQSPLTSFNFDFIF